MTVIIGTAGWSVPRAVADEFPSGGSHLARYASIFPGVEIDTSFYRHHKPDTYARWARTAPPGFKFAVKTPKTLTHSLRLAGGVESDAVLDRFLGEVRELGDALGPLLVQLPPSLAWERQIATAFFERLRAKHAGAVVVEPRHRSWFSPDVERLLADWGLPRVAADPAVVPAAASPGLDEHLVYYRFHGSPEMYVSAYGDEERAAITARLAEEARETWCIFDNTAAGHAAADALAVMGSLQTRSGLGFQLAPRQPGVVRTGTQN